MRGVSGYPIGCPHTFTADAGAAGWMSCGGGPRSIDVRGVGCSARRIPWPRCISVRIDARSIGVHRGRRTRVRWPCAAAAAGRTIRLRRRRIVGWPRWRRSRVIGRSRWVISRSRWVISRSRWVIGRSRARRCWSRVIGRCRGGFVLWAQGNCQHGNRQQN
jgi:hypothetical protein